MSGGLSRSLVVLGMMTKMPVPGVLWQTLHYLIGLRRLGYKVTYVEAHARTPSMFVEGTGDAGSRRAAEFVHDVLEPFGFGGHWAFHALHHDGAVHGMSPGELDRAYDRAELILNLCGGTQPRPEHLLTDRLALVLTDPVQLEVELWQEREDTRAFVAAHAAAFSFGENYGRPGCGLPVTPGWDPVPTRQPVVLDLWTHRLGDRGVYTTVANWHQSFRTVRYRADVYHWSKDREFRRFLDLPGRTPVALELALASYEPEDRTLLEEHGWSVRDALDLGMAPEPYRDYIRRSRGEFTVAKDQNVRLRSGWFSDRSATYLAAGRPVVTQDTGFGAVLPTGEGLFAVSDVDEAAAALERIEADRTAASRAALEVARGFFDARLVLPDMLAEAGVEGPGRRLPVRGGAAARTSSPDPREGIPGDLVLAPESRRPLRLPEATLHTLRSRPLPPAVAVPSPPGEEEDGPPPASVIVVTHGQLPLTRLCLESVLAHTCHPAFELVVVDNASPDDTPGYLRALAARDPRVRLILNPDNEGFASACNQGARVARGDRLVFLNNDTVVAPGWLRDLSAALEDASLGAVNPVTTRSGTEAELSETEPRTVADYLERAASRRETHGGSLRPARMLAFFCLATTRATWARIGELDEGFGQGLFEDDDWCARVLDAGLELACAEGVFVYHFGEASFGDLVADGSYARLFEDNRARFARKWSGSDGQPRAERRDPDYDGLVERVRSATQELVPAGAGVAVVSRGDARLLPDAGAWGCHFPSLEDGTWAGHYPADGAEAVEALESVRARGADFFLVPEPGFWWLDHYRALRERLEEEGGVVERTEDLILYRLDEPAGGRRSARGDGGGGTGAARAADDSGTRPAGATPRRGSDDREAPVFIIGSPRSGTSVFTWALGQHPNLYPLEETVWFGRFHSGALQAFRLGSSRGDRSQLSAMGIERGEFMASLGEAIDALVHRHRRWPEAPLGDDQPYARARRPDDPKRRWVDGTPENSFHVDELVELFPGAVFIHLLREPGRVARSLRRFHNIGGRRHDADEAYRKWLAHVRACLDAEESLGPERVLRVLHRDLASDPEAVVRRSLDFLGEPWEPACLLPLSRKINSSGDTPAPDEDPGPDEIDEALIDEIRSLEAELFTPSTDPR